MPSGDRISLQLREIISRLYLQYANTPGEIFAAIYQNNHELCSYDYLRKLCRKLRNPISGSYILYHNDIVPRVPDISNLNLIC